MIQDAENSNAEHIDAENSSKGVATVLLEDCTNDCIYTLTEQDGRGAPKGPKLQNGEKLILFYGREVDLFFQIGNESRFKEHQEAIQDAKRYYSIDNLSTITSSRQISVKLSCDGRFGTLGSDEDFEDITLEISENKTDSRPDVCFVRHFNKDDLYREACIFSLKLNSHWFDQIWTSLAADKTSEIMFWVQDGSLHHEQGYAVGSNRNIVKILTKSQSRVLEGTNKPLRCGDGVAEFAIRVSSQKVSLATDNVSEHREHATTGDINNALNGLRREIKSTINILQILCVVVGILVGVSALA